MGEHLAGAADPEDERRAALAVMAALRSQGELHELMRNVTGLLQRYSGCEAVGIRLAEGEDFPYYETRGFPDEFVALERHLCPRDAQGRVRRDGRGLPVLECMCGNVLRGRTDPAQPFFTPRGSFWSNGTTRLLGSTSAADRQAETRNRCNGFGYESVALVPLRSGDRTFGLLQVNDRQPGRFTPRSMELLEDLAQAIALALAERVALESLQRSLEEKDALLREVHHRVRNNLQTMVSLLRLHARGVTEPGARRLVGELEGRIAAMARVHDSLYAGNVAQVSIGAFVRQLLENEALAVGGEALALSADLSVDQQLPADRALPLGLIVHELVSNAVRHGASADGRVRLEVSLTGSAAGAVLRVSDQGPGFPEAVAFPGASSFGLSLVQLLARTLAARVELRPGPGATVELHLPPPEPRP